MKSGLQGGGKEKRGWGRGGGGGRGVRYLARLLGVGGMEGGGGHGVYLQESPHGPKEALMP